MKCPAEVYRPSSRVYKGLPDIDYPYVGGLGEIRRPQARVVCIRRKSVACFQIASLLSKYYPC
jgi:hypothetical protein